MSRLYFRLSMRHAAYLAVTGCIACGSSSEPVAQPPAPMTSQAAAGQTAGTPLAGSGGPGAGRGMAGMPAAGVPAAGMPGTARAGGSAGVGTAGAAGAPGAGSAAGSGASAGGAGMDAPAGASGIDAAASTRALSDLGTYLAMPRSGRPELTQQPFASVALTQADARAAREQLWADFEAEVRETRKDEVGATASQERTVSIEGMERKLRYYMARTGSEPTTGWSLFISMHGGGNTDSATNDSQWQNQIDLVDGYKPKDALWVAPRAPVDDWNMWFVPEIDPLFERLITDLIVFEHVDPNKVYINGYSAGGDGVYQIGPRMAERWAGAGMSAGHPNTASPLSLRNVAFAIHVGGDDTGYDRNKKAAEWGMMLEMLAAADPGGYINQWQVHAGKPHWMDLEDAVSIPFLQMHTRDPYPKKVVWEQAEVTRAHMYWLAVDEANRVKGNVLRAAYDDSGVHITAATGVKRVTIRLSDQMLSLDKPVPIDYMGMPLMAGAVTRTIATLETTLRERADPAMIFEAEVSVDLPASP